MTIINQEYLSSENNEFYGGSREHLTSIYANMLDSIGLTGREIAKISGTRPQYISDIKRRQRPLSQEMFLRTLHGLYGEYKWLISGDFALDTQRILSLYPHIADSKNSCFPLPVFRHPFLGPKMTTEDWDGAFMCVTSPIKDAAQRMRAPYILQLPFDDHSGRLRKGDYLLVEQAARTDASYVLIRVGWGVKLAKRLDDGGYRDVESGEYRFDHGAHIIGNVSMLLMGAL